MSDEQISLWDGVIMPLLTAFKQHTTLDQIYALMDEAYQRSDTPDAVRNVLQTLKLLRREIDEL